MPAYLAGRLLAVLPVMFIISLLAFGLEAITPGDPAYLLLQAAGRQNITSQELAAKRAELHLDDPVPVRYLASRNPNHARSTPGHSESVARSLAPPAISHIASTRRQAASAAT